jgi:hypothetical protein
VALYRVDRPQEGARRWLVPLVVFSMVLVALPILALLLLAVAVRWWVTLPPTDENLAFLGLMISALILLVWMVAACCCGGSAAVRTHRRTSGAQVSSKDGPLAP